MEKIGVDGSLIGFWTGASSTEIQALVKKAGLDFWCHVSAEQPAASVCLAMGAQRLKDLQSRGVVPKKFGLDASRGQVFLSQTGPVMTTFDPGFAQTRADVPQQIVWDIRLAYRYATTHSLKPVIGNYVWVDDLSEFIEALRLRYLQTGEPVPIAVDTETMGLNPYDPKAEIVTIQLSMEEGTAVAVYCLGMAANAKAQLIHQVKWLLTSEQVRTRGANWKFDSNWLWLKWGIACTNFSMDTTVVGSMLDENRSNSLKWHAKEYTPLGGYEDELEKTYDKGHMELVPKEPLLRYAAPDADVTLRVSNVMIKKLQAERHSSRLYTTLVHPALKAFEKVERRGVLVDTERMAELENELRTYMTAREHEMVALLSGRMRAKYAEKIADRIAEGKEPLTPAMKAEFFFDKTYGLGLKPKMVTPKSQEPSTSQEHLTMFHDVPEAKAFVDLMKLLGAARKTHSTYVVGFMKHLRADGRFHPTYMLFKGGLYDDDDEEGGTNTGRLSAQDPAWQTVPKHTLWAKKLRSCFPAPEGKVCWARDFSQGELRVVACVAEEDRMIQNYREGGDLHCVTAAQFAGMDYKQFLALEGSDPAAFKKWRQRGKTGNFGMLYDISADGFVKFAWRSQIVLTQAEAKAYLEGFFALFPGLRRFHDTQRSFARRHGFVASPLGRIRHLPLLRSGDSATRGKEERRAINSPIQSTLSDLCTWACARIEEELGDEAGLCGMIHDQLHGYVDADKAPALISQIGQIMEELPYRKEFGWDPALPFPTDGEWGPDLGAMTKFKLAE